LQKLGPFTIIANNCIAGFLYQKYNLQYYSPTIGLKFSQEDFVKFCAKFEYYINCKLEEIYDKKALGVGDIDYPIGKLDDVIIYFQHYKNFEDAYEKWEIRKRRINYEKLFFVFVVYNNTSIEILKLFESLPLKNKLIMTNEDRFPCSISVALHNGLDLWFETMKNNLWGKKYYEQYDFFKWFTINQR
jgi:uncharacterized protein (DUF1919 family)